MTYRKCETKDTALFDELTKSIEEMLYFESLFTAPQPISSTNYSANHFTARTESELGSGNQPGYEKLTHLFPYAALRQSIKKAPEDGTAGFAVTYPHIINSEEWAWRLIKQCYPKYENYFEPSSGRSGSSWPMETYDSFNSNKTADYSGLKLPCYEDDGFFFTQGEMLALKHKGIYLICVYDTDHSTTQSYSFLGGAPTLMWSEATGTTMRSNKYNSLTTKGMLPDESKVMHASVYGTIGGKFFHSGREGIFVAGAGSNGTKLHNTFTWIEEGKKFVIDGDVPNTGKNVSWTYDLTEKGIDITAKVSPIESGDDFWLNFPIQQADPRTGVEMGDGKIDVTYDGHKMSYTWDSSLESKWLPKGEKTCNNGRLRIKMPADGSLTIHVEAEH